MAWPTSARGLAVDLADFNFADAMVLLMFLFWIDGSMDGWMKGNARERLSHHSIIQKSTDPVFIFRCGRPGVD
jgi:hypothetical protein